MRNSYGSGAGALDPGQAVRARAGGSCPGHREEGGPGSGCLGHGPDPGRRAGRAGAEDTRLRGRPWSVLRGGQCATQAGRRPSHLHRPEGALPQGPRAGPKATSSSGAAAPRRGLGVAQGPAAGRTLPDLWGASNSERLGEPRVQSGLQREEETGPRGAGGSGWNTRPQAAFPPRPQEELPRLGTKTTSSSVERRAKGLSQRKAALARTPGQPGNGVKPIPARGAPEHAAAAHWDPLWASKMPPQALCKGGEQGGRQAQRRAARGGIPGAGRVGWQSQGGEHPGVGMASSQGAAGAGGWMDPSRWGLEGAQRPVLRRAAGTVSSAGDLGTGPERGADSEQVPWAPTTGFGATPGPTTRGPSLVM